MKRIFSRNLTIGTKLIIPLVLILVLGLGGLGTISIRMQRKGLYDEVQLSAERLNETIQDALQDAMMARKPQELRNILRNIKDRTGVKVVGIINREGIVTVASQQTEERFKVCPFRSPCSECHAFASGDTPVSAWRFKRIAKASGGRSLHLSKPIINAKRCSETRCHPGADKAPFLGFLHVEMDLTRADRRVRVAQIPLLLLSGVILAGAILLTWQVLRSLVTRPTGKLLRSIETISQGDLEHRIGYKSSDELGHLAEALNQMTAKLGRAQATLLESVKTTSRGTFASSVLSEINRHLASILTFGQELRDNLGQDEQRKRDCDVIIRDALRLRRIVKKLLDMSDTDEPARAPMDIGEVLDWTVSVFAQQKKYDRVRIVKEVNSDLPRVRGDREQIQQVFLNLIVNAIEAIAESGTVWVTAQAASDEEGVEIQIRDTGAGMPAEVQTRVFEPFFSAKEPRAYGLGLSAVQEIIEAHDGRISVESEPGRGARFTIFLPSAGPAVF